MVIGLLATLTAFAQTDDFNPTNPPEPKAMYRLTVTAQPAEAATMSGGGQYSENASVTARATARTNYVFKHWLQNGTQLASTSTSLSFKMPAKHTTLTAEISNGAVEDYTYKFIVYNKTTKQWYKLRDFEAANTFDWYTGPAGEKNLFVDVKAANGDVKRFQLDVNVTESDLAVKSFTISPEGVLPTKSQATLTAEAENGTAPYEYKFIVYNETTQQWYKLRDFEASNTFDWYTGPAGSKKLYVDVKDADGTVVRQELPVTVE